MARQADPDLAKHTLNLRLGDMDKLRELHPSQPPSTVVRTLVSKYVDNLFKPVTSETSHE
jgi:hypothetical protein